MGKIAVVTHRDYELHDSGSYHPECPARTREVVSHLKASDLASKLDWREPEAAARCRIESVHDASYRRFVEAAWQSGRSVLDAGDTPIGSESYRVAELAAGGALGAVDAVMNEGFRFAFSCARPPGHHARPATAMGFCLFNHIAIAARYAQQRYGIERVLIVDWDVHHGNGTQEIFYADPTVFFFSAHQYPFYPGTGAANERGCGEGRGATLNVPMAAGATMDEYRRAFAEQLLPVADTFCPELILISAGFDAHREDPLAGIRLEDEAFAELTSLVIGIAQRHCSGRVVSILEGGYNISALSRSVYRHLEAAAGVAEVQAQPRSEH